MDSTEPVDSAKSSAAIKQPPAETSQQRSLRRQILLSFWSIAILFGLPLWYLTTTVPRAALPLDRMNAWAGDSPASPAVCDYTFPLSVAIDADHWESSRLLALSQMVETMFNEDRQSSSYSLRISWPNGDRELPDPIVTLKLAERDSRPEFLAALKPFEPVLDVFHIPLDPTKDNQLRNFASFITTELRRLFAQDMTTMTQLIGDPTGNHNQKLGSGSAFQYAANYHLTFSLFSGSDSPAGWDIQAALTHHLQPLLDSFASISTFTVDSQVQLYASLAASLHGPELDADNGKWKLLKSDLSAFVNAAEWPLSPSIGPGPTINFVLYVPSHDQTPLAIKGTDGSDWLIPQWGGVHILNLPTDRPRNQSLTAVDLAPVMRVFARQLHTHLGLPATPSSFPLRVSSLKRQRTVSLMLSASSTLGALSRLSLKLTSIAIPDNVAASVDSALRHLSSACEDLHAGRFDRALKSARTADAEAEKAFFEPSMVGQVYFPDEHKIAVYVPLLGPMAVPMITAALKELKRWKSGGV